MCVCVCVFVFVCVHVCVCVLRAMKGSVEDNVITAGACTIIICAK